jgi:hypothetical protein
MPLLQVWQTRLCSLTVVFFKGKFLKHILQLTNFIVVSLPSVSLGISASSSGKVT